MGDKKTVSTQQTTIGSAGAQEQGARDILSQLASSGVDQMGNLSDLASGNLSLSPQDTALIQQIQRLSQEQARIGVQDNATLAMNQVEGNLSARGLDNSSIEAVDKALIGRQLQQSLDQSTIQGQITSADQMRKSVYDNAGIKLNANQLLLQQILGGANSGANLGLQERLAQGTTTSTQTQKGGQWADLAQTAARAGTAYATGGMSEAALAAS